MAASTLIATWFGCGLAKQGRGTVGSFAAVVMAIALEWLFGWRPWHFGLLAAAMLLPGVWAAGEEARRVGVEDPPRVVVDEVLGQWLTLAGASSLNWKSWLAAFFLFRLFDIWKPTPVNRLEALPGGWGIVADDLMAGLYGALVLFVAGCFNLY